MPNKIDELKSRISVSANPPDIIAITEIKPKNARFCTNEAELHLVGYEMHHINIGNDQGRGICVYTRSEFHATEVTLSATFKEYIALCMKIKEGDKLLLVTVYRSPNSELQNNNMMMDLLDCINDQRASHVLIVGDFNYPNINWDTGEVNGPPGHPAEQLRDKIEDCFWTQTVNQPTRKRGQDRPTTLDLIITNDTNYIDDITYETPLGNSDHCVISFEFHCYLDLPNANIKKFFLNKTNYNQLRKSLNLDWNKILHPEGPETDADVMWNTFETVITDVQEKCIPNRMVTKTRRKKRAVPLDKDILKEVKKKHRMWTRYMETSEEEKLRNYKRARNKVRNSTRRARRRIELAIAKDIKDQPKKFWNYVNAKTKVQSTIPDLEENRNGEVRQATTDKEKAEMLGNFFSQVLITGENDNFEPLFNNPVPSRLDIININEDKIIKKLKGLKTDKSPGPDNIFPKVLKEAAGELAGPLNIIFNRSLSTSTVPKKWKMGHIRAIHKKGSKKTCTNYRPISLTSIVCKIMEGIVRDEVMEYMKIHSYFSKQQFGFMPYRSTVLQLLKLIDEWTEALDNGNTIEAIYMDIQKAFDTVPHKRLIHKLEMYGLTGNLLNWLNDFLNDRYQYVGVNGVTSSPKQVTSGVPQGSVLGPLLFIIYINDLPKNLQSGVYMFADDTKIYKIHSNRSETFSNEIQNDLNALQLWSDNWLLRFHPEKCKQLHIKKPSTTTNLPTRHLYKYSGDTREEINLPSVPQEKDIGVLFDSHLNFRQHINDITKKASQMMGIIRRSFIELSPSVFRPLYISLVRSRLEYAQCIWSPYTKGEIARLERVQRNATKQVNGFKNLSYEERLQKLRLPTLTYRRKRGDMIEVFKLTHEMYDEEVKLDLPMANDARRGHRYKLYKQRTLNLDIRKYCFTNRVVETWNLLPSEVVESDSINTFKNRIDRHWRSEMYVYEE